MTITDFLFFAFAGVTIAAALGVVASKNPVHSALFLVLTFFSSAAIWLMLEAEFLAITLVLVYVGAVMVLFLFVVMMLMGTAALDNAVKHAADYSNTEALGEILYTDYVLAFEIAAIILLVAIIAAISLTLRRRPTTKYQTPGKQIKVKRDDRLKIIESDAEVLK